LSRSLGENAIFELPDGVLRPDYERDAVTPGVVHIGIGAFHRAHQAVYIDALLKDNPQWAIIGASLRRPDTKNALEPQDGLYTVAIRGAEGTQCRVIGSVLEVVDANTERDRLLDIMVGANIHIVSLTVTEKGYCHDPATGKLDETHKDIVHDLANPDAPVSAPGLIVEALQRRRVEGIAPFAVMSCDNLPANGHTAKTIITRLAELRDPDLGTYVATRVAFPGTMVDRIVPATTDEDRAFVDEAVGFSDAWPIMTEPFTQWVIEDNFPHGRPPFEDVGAEMVADVEPYERMKLRMLNGSHSTIAYLGYLSGYETVSDTIADPAFKTLIHDMMTDEIMPTLDMPGTDLGAYRDALLERFANPALKHRTWQIAMDGSQKLPQRLLDTIRARIEMGASFERLALGVAGWMRYATGIDENGQEIDVRDPLAERFQALGSDADGNAETLVTAFLGVREVFGDDLPKADAFRQQVTRHLGDLLQDGARATVQKLNSES